MTAATLGSKNHKRRGSRDQRATQRRFFGLLCCMGDGFKGFEGFDGVKRLGIGHFR